MIGSRSVRFAAANHHDLRAPTTTVPYSDTARVRADIGTLLRALDRNRTGGLRCVHRRYNQLNYECGLAAWTRGGVDRSWRLNEATGQFRMLGIGPGHLWLRFDCRARPVCPQGVVRGGANRNSAGTARIDGISPPPRGRIIALRNTKKNGSAREDLNL